MPSLCLLPLQEGAPGCLPDPISVPPPLLDQVMGPGGLLWLLLATPTPNKGLSFSKPQVLAPWYFQPHPFPAL